MNRRGVHVLLRGADGCVVADLTLRLLPGQELLEPYPLVEELDGYKGEGPLESIQLLEGTEYVYDVDIPEGNLDLLEPRELFFRDSESWTRGRLRTGNYTGRLSITALVSGSAEGCAHVEVRSRKLDYLTHYRWMLRDIAETAADVVMERFAPTTQRFQPDETSDSQVLYQRFAFLQALFEDDILQAALCRIVSRPHHTWESVETIRFASRGVPSSSDVGLHYMRPGPRTVAAHLPWGSVPLRWRICQHVETMDNPENQFVKFALSTWREVLARIADRLERISEGSARARGVKEVSEVLDKVDQFLEEGVFRDVGALVRFPASSQVLQKKAGYRDVLRSWLQFECAARLSWAGGDDVYAAGQRNVATLYEIWVFLELVRIVAGLCNQPPDLAELFEAREQDLAFGLRQGRTRALKGTVNILGRSLGVSLHYNKTFSPGKETWSRSMRPDYSIHIAPDGDPRGFWVHLDAKYRVDEIEDIFGRKDIVEADEDAQGTNCEGPRFVSKRADLLKMHAYRDAIRRSSGAYIVYPGNQQETCPRYHEILPGIGAFALRPTNARDETGAEELRQFLQEVLQHAALQTTQHERGRYWDHHIFSIPPRVTDRKPPLLAFLEIPPADEEVLLGYVKQEDHLQWIKKQGRYNVRAPGPPNGQIRRRRGSVSATSSVLAAPWVLLYGPHTPTTLYSVIGEVEIWGRTDMEASSYPTPRSSAYFCLPIRRHECALESELPFALITSLCPDACPVGAPTSVTWQHVLEQLACTRYSQGQTGDLYPTWEAHGGEYG